LAQIGQPAAYWSAFPALQPGATRPLGLLRVGRANQQAMAVGADGDHASAVAASRRPSLVTICCAAVAVAAVTAGLASASEAPSSTVSVAAQAPGRRLTTSSLCRQALEAMLTNEHWNFMNHSFTKWCRIKAENEMARCCGVADFELGRAESCDECFASCHHQHMIDLCSSYFGTACSVDRKLFAGSTLRVSETFCVPAECDNGSDRESLINWFATLYAARLSGWHSDWDDAILSCPSAAVGALLWTLLAIILTIVFLVILYFLMVAPKEAGRELISQEEMQAEAEAEAEKEAYNDLRGTAQMGGGESLGQTGLSR